MLEHALLDAGWLAPAATRWVAETGDRRSFRDWELDARREVLEAGLRPDLERVARVAADRLDADGETVEAAVAELSVHLDRYRTYLPDDEGAPALTLALAEAAASQPRLAPVLAQLVTELRDSDDDEARRVAHTLAAAHRAGDGEGRRGPGVLALHHAGVARRGRRVRRARGRRRSGRRAARAPRGDCGAVADDAAGRDDPRHQAIRGRARRRPGARHAGAAVRRAGRRVVRGARVAVRHRPVDPVARAADGRHHAGTRRITPVARSSSRQAGRLTCTRRGPIPTSPTSASSAASPTCCCSGRRSPSCRPISMPRAAP